MDTIRIRQLPSVYFAVFSQNKRLLFPFILTLLFLNQTSSEIVLKTLADAFLQVSVFVAATLYLYYYFAQKCPYLELSYVQQHAPRLEIVIASFLGALPGCGGAIIVVTQFTQKRASFGSVVAVLTSTMGDAAFLLIAKQPLDGLLILMIGFTVGIFSGYVVNTIHATDYLTPDKPALSQQSDSHQPTLRLKFTNMFWKVILIPSVVLALLLAFQFNFSSLSLAIPYVIEMFGACCGFFVILMWSVSSKGETYQELTAEDNSTKQNTSFEKVIQDTHFVTAWVVLAFILYEMSMTFLAVDLKNLFFNYAAIAPLIGVLIGLLPGCGPQIVVASLYIQGIIPFSALTANAISNDGDALFPAIALAPKAAFMATIYSTIPALLLGYSIYIFFE